MPPFAFHPVVARWFARKFQTPTEPQARGWPAIQSGEATLIAAPTGAGKTLAAFLASLDRLFRDGLAGDLRDETSVVYVSPLKALSNDIHKNLDEPLAEIRAAFLAEAGRDIEVRTAVRTGDTPAAARQAIIRRPPHILVTTPESLYLMLTSVSGRQILSTVRTLIVDEIHAVVENRRGSHLAVSMERLAALAAGPVQRIGISATQNPIEEVARFLVGTNGLDPAGNSRARIVDCGSSRPMDVAIELPGSPLEAVMSNEIWEEVYGRIAALIAAHRTTLVFVNTRRLAERAAHHLAEKLGRDAVMSHHGSLSTKLRHEAEDRLKRGQLKALVATASLELGIDIGSVDLVCQVGPTRSIATLLQRAGRAEHRRGGLPKARIFPLSRDELIEAVSALRCIRRGELDRLEIPAQPLDILAQQLVACAACEDWEEDKLYALLRSAYPYRRLSRPEFSGVLQMLTEGFSTRRGRRAALIHHDGVHHRVRARRGARLLALTSGGAIPDNGDYRVLLEPSETVIGSVNEDFAVESLAGDIFQLGNASWKILRINSGTVRVEDAHGQPPGVPFWLGESPGRTAELSHAVSLLRREAEARIERGPGLTPAAALAGWLQDEPGLPAAGAAQLAEYFAATYSSLGVIPSAEKLVLERFFDESGGMQLVLHAPFGNRVNRAWGLALRKRFCRSFNFELQAAATDDAIVLSLGTQHSFPLDEVFHYLKTQTVRDLLIQAVLEAPMFQIRWRWNATRSLALPRQRGGKKLPAPVQRMEAENLLAAVFPDQLACPENLAGDRAVPDHPLVRQTIDDCLTEAMDLPGLVAVLGRIEDGSLPCFARDVPEPSPLAHEILNAKPYAFLDNAPLEERRTRAVYLRRSSDPTTGDALGALDAAAIAKVAAEAWPQAANADELHDALVWLGAATGPEIRRLAGDHQEWIDLLAADRRIVRLNEEFWAAAERQPLLQAIFPAPGEPAGERGDALRELVRGRLEASGPITAGALMDLFHLPGTEIDGALLALEAEGFVLRGRFHPGAPETEWCDRRLLARIHRLTLNRLRAEIEPVSIAAFQRFLLAWQRVDAEHRAAGPEGLKAVLDLLDGYELPAGAWEPEILARRVKDYDPAWLDRLCFAGRLGWGRLNATASPSGRALSPVRSSPVSLFSPENLPHWLALSAPPEPNFSPDARRTMAALEKGGALFFRDLVRETALPASQVERALAEMVAQGAVTADGFEGLRALLVPEKKRTSFGPEDRPRRHRAVTGLEFAGRWSLLRPVSAVPAAERDRAVEVLAGVLLRRYGVVFRRLLEREAFHVPWFDLLRIYRRREARGEIRGGYFVAGVGGEQFALPSAIVSLRAIRRADPAAELVALSGADPLNLIGILTPGPRIAGIAPHRILLRDGAPLAALKARKVISLDPDAAEATPAQERALRVGGMSAPLRRYYA